MYNTLFHLQICTDDSFVSYYFSTKGRILVVSLPLTKNKHMRVVRASMAYKLSW